MTGDNKAVLRPPKRDQNRSTLQQPEGLGDMAMVDETLSLQRPQNHVVTFALHLAVLLVDICSHGTWSGTTHNKKLFVHKKYKSRNFSRQLSLTDVRRIELPAGTNGSSAVLKEGGER